MAEIADMNRILIAACLVAIVVAAAPVRAAAADDPPAQAKIVISPLAQAKIVIIPSPPAIVAQPPARRPASLIPLYVSLSTLQAYDGYSTLRGVQRGAREMNVLVGGLAGKPAAFWAVKSGSTAVSIFLAEKLWRNHRRVEAITTMIVSNGVMAAIAARNAAVLESRRH